MEETVDSQVRRQSLLRNLAAPHSTAESSESPHNCPAANASRRHPLKPARPRKPSSPPSPTKPVRLALTATVILLLVTLAPTTPPAQADHYKPITPGAKVAQEACTYNVIWQSSDGALYIGTAGHCAGPVGSRMGVQSIPEFGTVAYNNRNLNAAFTSAIEPSSGQAMDYALVRIDDDKHHYVDPQLRVWGGPTGITTEFEPGTQLFQYGQGNVVSWVHPARARTGVLTHLMGGADDPFSKGGHYQDWFVAALPVVGGDSGSLIITADGQALGIAVGLAFGFGHPGLVNGPTFEVIQRTLAADGFDLTMRTAPLVLLGDSDEARMAEVDHLVETCTTRPVDTYREDYCVHAGGYV